MYNGISIRLIIYYCLTTEKLVCLPIANALKLFSPNSHVNKFSEEDRQTLRLERERESDIQEVSLMIPEAAVLKFQVRTKHVL